MEQPSAATKQNNTHEKPNGVAEDAEVRREEWLNGDIKKFSKKQNNAKMKSFLREPLRPLRLCVKKYTKMMHIIADYKTLPPKYDVAGLQCT